MGSFFDNVKGYITGDSVIGCAFTIVNNIIGAGDMGLVFGFFFMILGSFLVVSFNLLLLNPLNAVRENNPPGKSGKDNRPASIEQLMAHAFTGPISQPIAFCFVKFCVFLLVMGIVVSYQIVLTEMVITMLSLVTGNDFFDISSLTCRLFMGTIVILCLCVFSLVKKIRGLRCVSFLSISVVIVLLITMLCLYFFGSTASMSSGEILWIPDLTDYRSYIKMVKYGGILTYSNMNLVVGKIHSEYKDKNLKRIKYSVFLSYFVVFCVYGTIALVGYLSFLDSTQDNIILSYQGSDLSGQQMIAPIFLRVLTFLQLFLTFPVIGYVMAQVTYELVESIYKLIRKTSDSASSKKKGGRIIGIPKVSNDDDDEGMQQQDGSSPDQSNDVLLDNSFDSMSTDEELQSMLSMDDDDDSSISLEEGGDSIPPETSSSSSSSSSSGDDGNKTFFQKMGIDRPYLVFTSISLLNTIVFGIVSIFYPKAKNVVGYVGGLPCLFFLIIFPIICWLRLVRWYKWYHLVAVIMFSLFSVIFLGVFSNTIQLMEDFGFVFWE